MIVFSVRCAFVGFSSCCGVWQSTDLYLAQEPGLHMNRNPKVNSVFKRSSRLPPSAALWVCKKKSEIPNYISITVSTNYSR